MKVEETGRKGTDCVGAEIMSVEECKALDPASGCYPSSLSDLHCSPFLGSFCCLSHSHSLPQSLRQASKNIPASSSLLLWPQTYPTMTVPSREC